MHGDGLFTRYGRALLGTIIGMTALPTGAATIVVNDLSDITAAADSRCTLREALNNANANAESSGGDCAPGNGDDSIHFLIGGTVALESTLNVTDPAGLRLDAVQQQVILSGKQAVRVIEIVPTAKLTINNLTVANGFSSTVAGGIENRGGTLNVFGSTFVGNTGAIHNFQPGSVTIANSTFTANNGFIRGGAIYNQFGTVTISNSTIVGNTVKSSLCQSFCTGEADGGGIYNIGTLNLNNSIVAGNSATVGQADIGGSVSAGGNNIVGNSPSLTYTWNGIGVPQPFAGVNGNTAVGDLTQVVTTKLADNGGPTQTLALVSGGLAIDKANDIVCAGPEVQNLDQRGIPRPQGDHCDIGAVEAQVIQATDLAVAVLASNPVMVRDNVSWTFVISNNGPFSATGVKVLGSLPITGLTATTLTATQGACSGVVNGTIACDLNGLAVGASAQVTIKGTATTAGTLTTQVSLNGDQIDNLPANNSVTVTTTVQRLTCNGLTPTIVGTPGPDVLTGTRGRDIIQGLGGDDTIRGGDSDDIICGGDGNDTLSGGNGADRIYGDNGNDRLNGDGGKDQLDGGIGTDSCNGGTEFDTATNCEVKTNVP